MFHSISRHGLGDATLKVDFASFADAKARFPHDERVALRAWARAEASRLANKLIGAPAADENFDALVSTLVDLDWVKKTALRQRRFDFVMMLMRGGKFERRIARRLLKAGEISAETARAVLS